MLPPDSGVPPAVEILDPVDPAIAAEEDALFTAAFLRAETGGRTLDTEEE